MHGPNNFAFIDGANLHFTYENMDWKIDYQKLRDYLTKRYNVTFAYYYIGKNNHYQDLHTTLQSYNYNLKFKDPSPRTIDEEDCPYCRKLLSPEIYRNKSDCDAFMTLEIISNRTSYDRVVLITSDGDFDEVVKWLLQQNKLATVLAPCKDGCSWLLKRAAKGQIAFIDDLRNKLEKI